MNSTTCKTHDIVKCYLIWFYVCFLILQDLSYFIISCRAKNYLSTLFRNFTKNWDFDSIKSLNHSKKGKGSLTKVFSTSDRLIQISPKFKHIDLFLSLIEEKIILFHTENILDSQLMIFFLLLLSHPRFHRFLLINLALIIIIFLLLIFFLNF